MFNSDLLKTIMADMPYQETKSEYVNSRLDELIKVSHKTITTSGKEVWYNGSKKIETKSIVDQTRVDILTALKIPEEKNCKVFLIQKNGMPDDPNDLKLTIDSLTLEKNLLTETQLDEMLSKCEKISFNENDYSEIKNSRGGFNISRTFEKAKADYVKKTGRALPNKFYSHDDGLLMCYVSPKIAYDAPMALTKFGTIGDERIIKSFTNILFDTKKIFFNGKYFIHKEIFESEMDNYDDKQT